MPKEYRAVPGDEEQSRSSSDTIYEKDAVAVRFHDDKFNKDCRTRAVDFASKNWPWIAHTVLLSLSLILFTLSFCQRTARISDLQVTQQYSSYCTARHPALGRATYCLVGLELTNCSTGGPNRQV